MDERPATVQAAVDVAFEQVKSVSGNWLYAGSPHYYLMNFNEDRLLEFVLQQAGDKVCDDVCVLDVGCCTPQWGDNAMRVFLSSVHSQGKKIQIFSVTGGSECEEATTTSGMVSHHVFNNFKIENIDEELVKRGHACVKFQLIVSNWTLRHLVDPLGTLWRLYELLVPGQGILMSNGFFVALDDAPETVVDFPGYRMQNWDLLLSGDDTATLFRPMNVGRDVGQFLVVHSGRELKFPLEYTGDVAPVPWGYQCSSGFATVFRRTSAVRGSKQFLTRQQSLFCEETSQSSKDLYGRLEALFYPE